MPWDDAKSVFRGFNFPDWVNQVEMGHFGGSDRKTNCTSGHFFWPRNAYPASKMSKKNLGDSLFYRIHPKSSCSCYSAQNLGHLILVIFDIFFIVRVENDRFAC